MVTVRSAVNLQNGKVKIVNGDKNFIYTQENEY